MIRQRRHPQPRPVCRCAGFTLTELMIAVAIIAILASIAVPGYRQYVERGNRAVAKAALSDVIGRQENYRIDRKQYATTLRKLGWNSGTLYLFRDGTLRDVDGRDSIYRVTLEGNPADTRCRPGGEPQRDGFTVVAEPIHSQASDTRCGTLCLSSVGVKSAGGSSPGDCWTR